MRTRHEIEHQLNTPGLTGPTIPGVGRLMVELLLDIRDLLVEIRDQEHVVNFVPPDYGKEDQLL